MIVCDRCKLELQGVATTIKIMGKTYSLCMNCAELTANYIQYSAGKGSPLIDKFKGLFKK